MPNSKAPKILVRGTNWVGDAVMTLPALTALASNYTSPITVMTRPWALGVYEHHPAVSNTIAHGKSGLHRGLSGRLKLVGAMAKGQFDLAVLFQNAFEAAMLARLAGIPHRWGYARDGRGFLLSKAIELKPEDFYIHEAFYYLELLERCGLSAPFSRPQISPQPEALKTAEELLKDLGVGPDDFLVGLAPGAAFGSAKRWPVENFAQASRLIKEKIPHRALIFGGPGEVEVAAQLAELLPSNTLNLAGKTSLAVSLALLARCRLMLTNDSGLMHLAGALDLPLVAAFGPTNPLTTAPLGRSRLVRSQAPCSPCLKRECPLKRRICFDDVTAEKVASAALDLLAEGTGQKAPAVFLDRDGTLIEEVNFLSNPEQVLLTPGVGQAVAALNRAGYKVVIVTNQSGLARGLFTEDDLAKVHERLHRMVAARGGRIDAIYYCPHHPHEGVVEEWVGDCDCRKPAPGMFQRAAEELSLDLKASIWVGDRRRDWAASELFGGRSVQVMTGYGLTEAKKLNYNPTLVAPNLKRAAEWIVS